MNILVLNAGSSTQKMALFPIEEGNGAIPSPIWEVTLEWTGDEGQGTLTVQASGTEEPKKVELTQANGRQQAVANALAMLWSGKLSVLSGPEEITAVGHRVVHGGKQYRETTRVTAELKAALADLVPLAPTHLPASIEGIEAVTQLLGDRIPQFAAFDTAFHSTLPDAASIYAGPYAWREEGIRKYGFHGISHRYCSERAASLLGRKQKGLRIISCHLGNGCSLAAIRDGHSVDTTMGFTPMEGLMMGTRSGSIDPGVLLYLQREKQEKLEHLDHLLNWESGLKGISGISGDMREIAEAMDAGNLRARLAFDAFIYRLRWHIGAMLPALGGLDALIFTAGIGEHSASVRAAACEGLDFLGIHLDLTKNSATTHKDRDISVEGSPVRILVIATQEDAAIARECASLLDR